jgi:hypothetical protein
METNLSNKYSDLYSINMPLMRSIDAFLSNENNHATMLLNITLKVIYCQQCNACFDTLSNLHNHMVSTDINCCPNKIRSCIHCYSLFSNDSYDSNALYDPNDVRFLKCNTCLSFNNQLNNNQNNNYDDDDDDWSAPPPSTITLPW